MKKHIITFEVSAKKNDRQVTTWQIKQEVPYNYIDKGFWRERNPKIQNSYKVYLLKSDIDLENMNNSRLDYAGYSGNKGEIVYRGTGMGEIILTAKKRSYVEGEYELFIYTDNRIYTKGEKDFLELEVYPKIEKYILENSESLYNEALETAKDQVKKQLEDYLKRYDELKKQSENFFIKTNDY